jgi:hypothetical protein
MVAVFVFNGGETKTEEVTMTFVGFSNYINVASSNGAPMHAWFWLTNGSKPVIWQVMSVGRKMDAAWVDKGPVRWWSHQRVPDPPQRGLYEPAHQVELISFAVDDTKPPLRVVLKIMEQAKGVEGAWERLRQWHTDHVRRRSELVLMGRHYSVTNDFYPKP